MTVNNEPTTPVPVPMVAPGRDNPVVCHAFDWARDERNMFTALGLKLPTCQAVTGGLTCTRPGPHAGPHAAGTGFSVVAVWHDNASSDGAA